MRQIFKAPAGYEVTTRDGLTIVIKKGYDKSFEDFVIPKPVRERQAHAPSGRGPLSSHPLRDRVDERALVRTYRRGGLLGRLMGGLYLNIGTPRSFRELDVSEYARAHDIPTPEVLAAACEEVTPLFCRCALATREIHPDTDLKAALLAAQERRDEASLRNKRRTISSLGRLIGRMHRAGIYHADLHLRNIFASGDGLHVLDLDAARVQAPLPELKRCRNLLRLYRSVLKLDNALRVTRTDLLRFIGPYAEESSCPARELTARLTRLLPLWRLKWKLSDILGI